MPLLLPDGVTMPALWFALGITATITTQRTWRRILYAAFSRGDTN